MKKLFGALVLVAALACTGQRAMAQSHLVKVNLLSPMVRSGSVFYEHTLGSRTSMQLGMFYTGNSISELKLRGYGITPEFRYYVSDSKEAPRGFYVGPFVRYRNFGLSTNCTQEITDADGAAQTVTINARATLNNFGGGLVVGHQLILSDRISIDVFAGPSYSYSSLQLKDNVSKTTFDIGSFDGFGFRTGLTLGVVF